MQPDTLPLARAEDCTLLVVDTQERLVGAMPVSAWASARDHIVALATAAATLSLPTVVTRQYPRGLGELDANVAAALPDGAVVCDKTCFAATGPGEVREALAMTGRRQVVVCGVETHVCVLQTAAGLLESGYQPFVVADAVCSRREGHTRNALDRMQAGGAVVTNHESVLFEWLRDASHAHFKTLSRLVQ